MHGAVDLLVVGWFGDATNLSAVFTGSNLVQMATMLIAGLTMGATVLIGRYIGENNPKRAGKAVGAAICMFAVVAVMISLLMVIFAPGFSAFLKVPEEARAQCISYMRICKVKFSEKISSIEFNKIVIKMLDNRWGITYNN